MCLWTRECGDFRRVFHGRALLRKWNVDAPQNVVESNAFTSRSSAGSVVEASSKGLPKQLRFAIFEINLESGELSRRGQRVPLQDQPFAVLAMLLERPGEIVTREQLRERLWGRTIVDFDHGLNKAVNKIRRALGDSAECPRFVETVARRGYRFLADVRAADDAPRTQATAPAENVAAPPTTAVAPSESSATSKPDARATTWKRVGLGLALPVAAALSWSYYARTPSPKIRSLAVLPLASLATDASQDYFADGMTDELIADLGQISALRVISRTSSMVYKGASKPLPQIARELAVDAVVEGTVLRSGGRVRITAQLIQVPDERRLWSQSYEEDIRDTLALQNRIAREIANQVQATLNREEAATLKNSQVVNPDAYEAYLKGRFFWNKRTSDGLQKAIEYFDRAIDKDSNYAKAYSGLADSYALLGDWEYGVLSPRQAFPKAKTAALRAITLDDTLGEAHASLAFVHDLYDWDWASAEKEYESAIARNPGYATAHHWYAWHQLVMGHNDEGIAELRKAQGLDPLSLIISADLADALCIAHRVDEALGQASKTIDMDPNFAVAHYQLGQALEQKRLHDQAIVEFRRAIELSGRNPTFDSNLAYSYAASGRRDLALKILDELSRRQSDPSPADAAVALIYVGLGDHDRAIAMLQKAFAARFNPSILLRPAFDPLRSDPRFVDLLRHIGMPTRDH